MGCFCCLSKHLCLERQRDEAKIFAGYNGLKIIWKGTTWFVQTITIKSFPGKCRGQWFVWEFACKITNSWLLSRNNLPDLHQTSGRIKLLKPKEPKKCWHCVAAWWLPPDPGYTKVNICHIYPYTEVMNFAKRIMIFIYLFFFKEDVYVMPSSPEVTKSLRININLGLLGQKIKCLFEWSQLVIQNGHQGR